MMDLERCAQDFWGNGYLVIENFFEKDMMDHLSKVILEYFGTTPEFWHNDEFLTKGKTEVVPWFPQNEGVKDFDELDENPVLIDLTAKILGKEWQRQYCMVMFSKHGTKGQAWHQDCQPEDPTKFNMNRLVYSMDITPEIGGQTVVVPGTHRKGVLPAGDPEAEMEGQVVLEPRKGTLILLHGHTWHRVLPVKGEYRFSTNYRSASKGTPEDVTDVCVYRNMRYRFSTSEVIEERFASA